MRKGSIINWDFTRYYAADGASKSTQEALTDQIEALEARLLQIPQIIAAKKRSLTSMQSDYEWLSSLSKSRQRKYEKEKGVHPHVVSAGIKKQIGATNSQIAALNAEKGRIPNQIETLNGQLQTLIDGESEGLSKGLDKETAKELGEIELQKQNEALQHQATLQEIETQKAQALAREEIENKKSGGGNTKLFIGIGIAVVLIIAGIIIYRRRMAKLNIQPLKA